MSRSRIAQLLLNLALGIILLAIYGVYLLLDMRFALSLDLRTVAIAYLLGLPLLLPFLLAQRRIVQIALPLGLLCAMLAVRPVDWDSRKPFLRALDRIEVGMTVPEVDVIMANHTRHPTDRTAGDGEAAVSYRHTNEGWGDSDIIVIRFSNGRVTSREFLPD